MNIAIVGCYVMHLYCQGKDHPVGLENHIELTGRNERDCFTEATERGWFVRKRAQYVLCPACRRRRKPKQYARER